MTEKQDTNPAVFITTGGAKTYADLLRREYTDVRRVYISPHTKLGEMQGYAVSYQRSTGPFLSLTNADVEILDLAGEPV